MCQKQNATEVQKRVNILFISSTGMTNSTFLFLELGYQSNLYHTYKLLVLYVFH